MCRIFGFKSKVASKVHSSLIHADNALMRQSPNHPDGWGVAYYVESAPHIVRSLSRAIDDKLFKKVSGIVSSQTVVAHLRKMTTGESSVLDTHPFQYGNWIFTHNGNIKNFSKIRPAIEARIPEDLKPFILGNTDSELIFYLIIGHLRKKKANLQSIVFSDLLVACQNAINEVINIAGPLCKKDSGPPTENFLTFLITNGSLMLAYQGGKNFYYSTFKKECPDRFTCQKFREHCLNEPKSQDAEVSHVIFSSEPIEGVNVWKPIGFQSFVGVDDSMRLTTS